MKMQFSIWQALLCTTIVSLAIFAWASNSNYRTAISALQTENQSLHQRLANESERLKLTERALLIQMKDSIAEPPTPFSAHGIAKEVAQRIAIEYPNDQYIWWVLKQTDALYDGIPIGDAVGMLGPAADQSNPKFMVWYDADAHHSAKLKLRASVDGEKLESWVTAHGFRD